MNKKRQEMMDKVVKELGFENEWTVWFCQLCEDEKLPDMLLAAALHHALEKGFE